MSPIIEFESIHLRPRVCSMSVVCKVIVVWGGPLNHVSDACLQKVLSYLCPCTIRQFAWVNQKWKRVLKVMLKRRLVEMDPDRWPSANNFDDDVSVAELEAMYDGHPNRMLLRSVVE